MSKTRPKRGETYLEALSPAIRRLAVAAVVVFWILVGLFFL